MSVAALTDFGRMLREAGVPADTRRIERFCDAASRVDGSDLYWVGQATLVSRPDQLPIYDRVFRAFFGGVQPERQTAKPRLRLSGAPANPDDGREALLPQEAPEAALASSLESIRVRSFSRMTRRELDEVARLMTRLQLAAPTRRSRRRRTTRKGEADMRRTLRLALRTGGEPIQFAYRARRERRRRLVLMLDISGSMGAFSRALLVFGHAALAADQHWEVFSFGTRLTRLTTVLRGANVDQALAQAAHAAVDWDGGTRIGDAVREMLARYSKGNAIRGAVVVICSDGLDVGEPELLAAQMARLHRLAHKIVWLNPLQENPEFQPLARGMAAALPHIDLFGSGHNLADLEETCAAIGRL